MEEHDDDDDDEEEEGGGGGLQEFSLRSAIIVSLDPSISNPFS